MPEIKCTNGVTIIPSPKSFTPTHDTETRDFLFTLSNGINIYGVNDGAGRLKFWFSTSNDLSQPSFDIRHYMADAQQFYYENYRFEDATFYENIWHERVRHYLERFFLPMLSSVDVSDGFIVCQLVAHDKSLPLAGLPLDYWYLIENWKFVCEYSGIDNKNVCTLSTGELWVSSLAITTAQKISLPGLKRNENIKKITQK